MKSLSGPPAAFSVSCPLPASRYDRILLGHGSGGRLSADLVADVFLPAFANPTLAALEDQATVHFAPTDRIAVTTDSFVVQPIFFPGGDIGRLAVHGTVNDLAVGGAKPLSLAAAFILEEGFEIEKLRRIAASMSAACEEAGVQIVAGDTKVVERGKGDSVFITTTGIGLLPHGSALSIASARAGDRVLVSGSMGDHGLAILSVREGLSFETALESDCAPLTGLVHAMMRVSSGIRCMRDPTRGGLSSSLNEIAQASRVGIEICEGTVPVRTEVRGACELLGLDPFYAACEGRLVAVVAESDAGRVLDAMRAHPLGRAARDIGSVVTAHPRVVTIRTGVGGVRTLAMLAGEALPRIC